MPVYITVSTSMILDLQFTGWKPVPANVGIHVPSHHCPQGVEAVHTWWAKNMPTSMGYDWWMCFCCMQRIHSSMMWYWMIFVHCFFFSGAVSEIIVYWRYFFRYLCKIHSSKLIYTWYTWYLQKSHEIKTDKPGKVLQDFYLPSGNVLASYWTLP